jgi:hypothetical protein
MSKKNIGVGLASGAVLRISETFNIRKIDPKIIVTKFFKGYYNNRTLPEGRIRSTLALVRFGKEIGTDKTSEIYSYKDKNNNGQIIYTTNHALYKFASDTSVKDSPILKCKYCKRGNLKKPIGLPISMIIDKKNPNLITFNVIDSFCDFGCAFSNLKRRTGESRMYRGPLYSNAEQLLHCFYYRVYPDRIGKTIKEKPDWDLLRENGGPLTSEEFDSESSEYIPVPSLSLLPSKNQYMKLNL